MDESLSEFQEPKKSCKRSKPNTKAKPKRALKKIRGQKDIRSVLKGKQELESYSRDFEKVCKKAGINIDSEELQLAIALSKSLQNQPSTSQSEPTTSRERIGKIRTTLQEYGFKVPEIKINTGNRKQRKLKKEYKLTVTSDIEKKERIASKYSEVLIKNINHNLDDESTSIDNQSNRLYHLATSVDYNILKNLDTFYVDNLLEKSTSTGNLLRDWSKIPGRASSPKLFEPSEMDFSEIECTPEEIDIVLSGTLKNCQSVIEKKISFVSHEVMIDKHCDNHEIIDNHEETSTKNNVNQETISIKPNRSYSPDIFDDDAPTSYQNNLSNAQNIIISEEPLSKKSVDNKTICDNMTMDLISKRKSMLDVELIECIEVETNLVHSQVSQKSDSTKRISNDFMEITECVATSSQPLIVNDKIDLTQIDEEETHKKKKQRNTFKSKPENSIDLTDKEYFNGRLGQDTRHFSSKDSEDLTQSSDSEDELPFVDLSNKNKNKNLLEDTIVLDLNDYPEILKTQNKTEVHIDLTQNENMIETKKASQSFFDEFLHDHSEERSSNCNGSKDKDETVTTAKTDIVENHVINISPIIDQKDNYVHLTLSPINRLSNSYNIRDVDLTQKSNDSNSSPCGSQFEKLIQSSKQQDLEESSNSASTSKNMEGNTEVYPSTSHSRSIESYASTSKQSQSYSSLGKKGDVSIDYDELSLQTSKNAIEKSCSYEIPEDNLEPSQNIDLSQNSEVFQISDKELDYSMHKSYLEKVDNFAIGGISVIENLSNLASFKKSIDANIQEGPNNEMLRNREISPIKHRRIVEINTPQISSNIVSALTPKNSEFIIKTNDVTPMVDYEAMSTPEIHKELDKYGIKPFKRKRAIQLLTHIYNQTHPVVENCDEFASPPKRLKPNTSPKKGISPRKLILSLNEKRDSSENNWHEKENNSGCIREINVDSVLQVPISTEIECNPEDWVFQKREKAKIKSCRVPLHVAFYNYVRSRDELREAILRYEPVSIDDIHKDLVGYGHRYDPKDLLKFLDKKCITVKTTDNESRNQKR